MTTMHSSLERLGLPYRMLGAGLVEVRVQLQPEQYNQLKVILMRLGLELADKVSHVEFGGGSRS